MYAPVIRFAQSYYIVSIKSPMPRFRNLFYVVVLLRCYHYSRCVVFKYIYAKLRRFLVSSEPFPGFAIIELLPPGFLFVLHTLTLVFSVLLSVRVLVSIAILNPNFYYLVAARVTA